MTPNRMQSSRDGPFNKNNIQRRTRVVAGRQSLHLLCSALSRRVPSPDCMRQLASPMFKKIPKSFSASSLSSLRALTRIISLGCFQCPLSNRHLRRIRCPLSDIPEQTGSWQCWVLGFVQHHFVNPFCLTITTHDLVPCFHIHRL